MIIGYLIIPNVHVSDTYQIPLRHHAVTTNIRKYMHEIHQGYVTSKRWKQPIAKVIRINGKAKSSENKSV